MDMDELESLTMVQEALEEGGGPNLDFAQGVVADLLSHEPTTHISVGSNGVDIESGKGDVVVALVVLGITGVIGFFAIRAAIKEEKRAQEEREKARRKAEEEEEKMQMAASRGATVLPKPGGGYYIVENERSLAILKDYERNEVPAQLHPHLEEPSFGNGSEVEKTPSES